MERYNAHSFRGIRTLFYCTQGTASHDVAILRELTWTHFREGKEGGEQVTLKEYFSDVFLLYLQWTNRGDKTDRFDFLLGELAPEPEQRIICLIRTWMMADFFEDPMFADHIIDRLVLFVQQLDGHWLRVPIIEYFFDNTGPTSALRALIVDYALYGKDWDIKQWKEAPGEFLYGVLCRVDELENSKNSGRVTLTSAAFKSQLHTGRYYSAAGTMKLRRTIALGHDLDFHYRFLA
jgi:hypothetical protein